MQHQLSLIDLLQMKMEYNLVYQNLEVCISVELRLQKLILLIILPKNINLIVESSLDYKRLKVNKRSFKLQTSQAKNKQRTSYSVYHQQELQTPIRNFLFNLNANLKRMITLKSESVNLRFKRNIQSQKKRNTPIQQSLSLWGRMMSRLLCI